MTDDREHVEENVEEAGVAGADTAGEDATADVAESADAADAAAGAGASAEDPVAVLEREKAELHDRWLRAHAELDNVRKRARREVAEARTFAAADALRPLLEILDNLERAVAHAAEGDDGDALRSGVALIRARFREILAAQGVADIPAEKGQPFDPGIHEAVMQMESDEVEAGAIVEVAQNGYRLGELVLRPSRVVVAR